MATLREFILNQSSLVTGNTVRDHIKNPSEGGGVAGGYIEAAEPIQVAEACPLVVMESEIITVTEKVILTLQSDQDIITIIENEILGE